MYQVSLQCSKSDVDMLSERLNLLFQGVSAFQNNEDSDDWTLTAYSEANPNGEVLDQLLPDLAYDLIKLPETDWLLENYQGFPPLRIDRFYIYGDHITEKPPAGSLPIRVNAATAFGTGEHESTKGCLLALQYLSKQPMYPKRILDLGCGSGILAMAVSKIFKGSVILATDNHCGSVNVARHNARLNHLTTIKTVCIDGYRPPINGTYDLIFSNIFARPLCHLSPKMYSHLKPGGYNISAGLLSKQSNMVEHAYRQQGLVLHKRIVINNWAALIFQKPTVNI